VLVATDVAGRGLDVKNLPYVVNYDFPSQLETYIYRIGRTSRLAADGPAYSFFTRNLASLALDLISLSSRHCQFIDPNLIKLGQSYKEASQFLEDLEQIERGESPDSEESKELT